ncbi:methyl-accepting chemotaxis protein [Pseudomonas turukhanskensis]|uniref:Methyl-accepting chemotaxis protein n=2 Tax=Pseudomonas turukhanskensis TaxID=1806536 RepID=A0A9W6NIY4_9PSED|nr:methyl-accepting chemotaxis protein [Pseudomonas turukhanskensis]GLK92141.1 methyl-accepting chemotaxis protein [Pseudomonas turukhanskensis]
MLLRRLKIAPRAIFSFSLVALLVVLLGLFALSKMKDIRATTVDLNENSMPSYAALGTINEKMLRLRIIAFRFIVEREGNQLQAVINRENELVAQLHQAQATYEPLISPGAETEQYKSFKALLEKYYDANAKLAQLSTEGKVDEMKAFLAGEYKTYSDGLGSELEKLMEINRQQAASEAKHSEASYDAAVMVVVAFMLIAAALTGILAVLLTRSIVNPLNEAMAAAATVAKGDLTGRIVINGIDEPALLLGSLHAMQQSLKDTIHHIAQSSDQLASAAEELNAVTEDSSRGLHQQNTEIEQAATAVNEMTTAVDEVARNAVATSEASNASDRTARLGQDQVNKTVNSISDLAGDVSSTAEHVEQLATKVRDISKVLDVIRSIAEQTNLLALNAAIEAARAGDAGRGFAVVADEVRALAHRTQQSTQEIEQMISGIQQGTDQAMNAMQSSTHRANSTLELARAAGAALAEITEAISHISERNLVIASASEEQAQVAREVDRNLVNIRDLAQQTSAGAHETSAASQDLSRLAVDLNTLVNRFTL